MSEKYDVIVVGGGVMGGATALELVRRGHRVALLERFERGHSRGSSHGPTRIFRLSYPDPDYVRFADESREDWRRLERDTGKPLIEVRGGIDFGAGAFDCADAMEAAEVEVFEMSGSELDQRFPLRLPPQARGIFQPDAGVIAAELTVSTQLDLASRGGSEVRFNERMLGLETVGDEIKVTTQKATLFAEHVVLAGGAWMAGLAKMIGIDLPLRVTREQVAYFTPCPAQMPVIIDWDHPVHYLVPEAFGAKGMKVGLHHDGAEVDPEDGPFEPIESGTDEVADWVEGLTGIHTRTEMLEACLYTNAPGEDFIMRKAGSVVVISACSGHGFKFAPRIGRVAADLVEGKDPALPERIASVNF